jgi:hypothetical protein
VSIERQRNTLDLGHGTPSGHHLLKLEWLFDVCCKGFASFPKVENCHAQAMFFLFQEVAKNPTIKRSKQQMEKGKLVLGLSLPPC